MWNQSGGASAQQKGRAAEMRTFVSGSARSDLNKIVHSGDKDPHKYGKNQFADPSNSYDPKAQKALNKAQAKMKK